MSRRYSRRSNSVIKLIKFIERAIVTVFVIGFIILISVQIILINTNLKSSLSSKFSQVREFLKLGQRVDFQPEAKPVFSVNKDRKYIMISLMNEESELEAKLIMNGEIVDDFNKGYVRLNIEEGDYITIDTRGIKEGLWFEIKDKSKGIGNFQIGQQIWLQNEFKSIGRVEESGKF